MYTRRELIALRILFQKSDRVKMLMLILELINLTITLATSEMLSHAPPAREYFPSPILDKITAAESSGPTANGVRLKKKK